MPTSTNAINEATTGIVGFTGTAFTATPVTTHDVLLGGATSSAIAQVAPSATSGIPLVSGGSSADPSFTTAVVAGGGTGDTSFTAYTPVCGGTTTTGALQSVASIGSSGQVLTSNGASALPTFQAVPSSFSPNSTLNLSDDFISVYDPSRSFLAGQLGWDLGSVAGFSTLTTTSNAHPGIIQNAGVSNGVNLLFLSGTDLTTTAALAFILGGGAITMNWVVKINTLSSSTYTLRFGFGDTMTSSDQVNGVYFQYRDTLNSGDWVGTTASASTRSSANSAVAADTNWHNFQITINAGATSIGYFIDGVQIANSPLTTNIPTTAVVPFLSMSSITASTIPANAVYVDLFYMTQTLTSAR